MNAYFSYEADWLKQRNAPHTAAEIWQQPIQGGAAPATAGSGAVAAVPAPLLANSAANRAVRRRQLGVRRPRPAPPLRERTGRDVAAYGTTADTVANPRQYLDPERPTLLSFARSGNSPKAWRRWSWPTSCCRKATT